MRVYDLRVKRLSVMLLAGLVAAAVLLPSCGEKKEKKAASAKPEPVALGFVGSETCKECHPKRHKTWLGTAHAYSLREPTKDSVAGRFDGKPVEARHFRATPYQQGGEYYIRVEGRDGRPSGDHRVTRVVGRTFEQAYLLTGPRGEWRVLPICWSIERSEWDLTHEVLKDILGGAPSFPKNYDTRQTIFNYGCGQCHATDYDVGYDSRSDIYQSDMLEGAVACESCHGPGSVHTAWHQDKLPEGTAYEAPARLVHPKEDLDAKQVLDTCGRCHYLHEWRFAIDDDPLVSHHDIAVSRNFDRSGFYADGRLSGLNYHGTTQSQSACFLEGDMSCLSCHTMHGRKPWAMRFAGGSDAQCTQCHDDEKYPTEAHHHHEAAAGVRCVDCHMPKFFTGILHFARDHSIRTPEPELTERFGQENVPNACNACHDDKTAGWAREWKEKWGGKAPRRLVEDVAQVVALRNDAESVPAKDLVATLTRKDSLLFFRMTALENLAKRRDPEAVAGLVEALRQEHVEILQRACEHLGVWPDHRAAPLLQKLIEHPVRTVRLEAGYALARCGWRGRTPALERVYKDSLLMLERQKHLAGMLERIAMLADVIDEAADFKTYYEEVLRLARWPAHDWPGQAIDLLHRHARRTAEEGNHGDALELYAKVREFAGEKWPRVLLIDSADSIAALGRQADATGVWEATMRMLTEQDPLRIIAAARLSRDPTALVKLRDKLADNPAAGKLLRRVRWSLRVLGR